MQRIAAQLNGLMSSLADVEKLAATLQADTDATRKACACLSALQALHAAKQQWVHDTGLLRGVLVRLVCR